MKSLSKRKLTVGVIGCGGIGQVHLSNYQFNGIKITGVADSNKAAARRMGEKYECVWYTNYKEMLMNEKPDAVSVCTPPAFHKAIVLEALHQKIHVLCEKPLAVTVKEAKMMVDTAKKNKRILMTAFCHRYQWQVAQAKKWIRERKVGDIVLYHNRFAGYFSGVEKTWFVQKKLSGGGMFIDTLIHSIDLFRYLVGEVKDVKAEYQTFHPKIKVEDTGILLLQSKSGALGTLEGSWQTPVVENVIEIIGTKGAIYINYNNNHLKYRFGLQKDWETVTSPDIRKNRFYLEIENFLKTILGKQKLLVTGEDGLKAMEILDKAYASSGK